MGHEYIKIWHIDATINFIEDGKERNMYIGEVTWRNQYGVAERHAKENVQNFSIMESKQKRYDWCWSGIAWGICPYLRQISAKYQYTSYINETDENIISMLVLEGQSMIDYNISTHIIYRYATASENSWRAHKSLIDLIGTVAPVALQND